MSEPLEFRASETVGSLTKALCAAAKAFGPVVKDRMVNMGENKAKYAYATLLDYLEATRPALCENGLAVVQMPAQRGERTAMVTRLMHESGEWIEAAFALPPAPQPGPQGTGSAISYARKYAYTALLGIAAEDDDDDGNKAQGNTAKIERRPQPQRQVAPNKQATGDGDTHDPDTKLRKALATGRVWWLASSSSGDVTEVRDREAWEKEWRVRISAVETSKQAVPQRRAKLEAMLKANAAVFRALADAGHQDAVSVVTAASAKADARLSELASDG